MKTNTFLLLIFFISTSAAQTDMESYQNYYQKYDYLAPYSDLLQQRLDLLKTRKYNRAIRLHAFYKPMFLSYTEKQNLIPQLAFLPILESNMNPLAISKMNARGYWQFLTTTGQDLGMKENECISNYYDPEASTFFATRYLKSLYEITEDWNLTLIAYNYGIGNLKKLQKKYKTKDIALLYDHLPKETKLYLLDFSALNFLIETNYFETNYFNFNSNDLETIAIENQTTLKKLQNSYEYFDFLNPQITCNIIYPGTLIYVRRKKSQ